MLVTVIYLNTGHGRKTTHSMARMLNQDGGTGIHFFNVLPRPSPRHVISWKQNSATFMKGHESNTRPLHHHHGQQNRLPPTYFSHAVEHGVRLTALALATWYFDCIYMNSIKFLHGPVTCYLQKKTHFLNQVSSWARQASFSSTALTQFTPWSIRLSNLLLVDINGYQITSSHELLAGKRIHFLRRSQRRLSSAGDGIIRSICTDLGVVYILTPLQPSQLKSVDMVMVFDMVLPLHLILISKLVHVHPFSCNNGLATSGSGAKVIRSRRNMWRGDRHVLSGKQ